MTHFCPFCGATVRSNADYCTSCGTALSAVKRIALDVLSPGKALAIGLAAYFAALLTYFGYAALGGGLNPGPGVIELVTGAIGICGFCAMPSLGRKWLLVPKLGVRGVLLTCCALVASWVAAALLVAVWPFGEVPLTVIYGTKVKGLYRALFDLAILTPIIEELLFRGVILDAFRHLLSNRTAVVLTTLLFAIAHASPVSFIHLCAMGYLCGELRIRTSSLWPCVFCHAVYNAGIVLADWVLLPPVS